MLVEVNCPHCRHRGHVPEDMLRRSLKCSRCGTRARFAATKPLQRAPFPPKQVPTHPSFVERAEVPDDLARLLWGEKGV